MIKIHDQFHPILKRQVKRYLPQGTSGDEDILSFIRAVHETYVSNDEGRMLMEHSLVVSSEELMQKNSEIRTIFQAFLCINSSELTTKECSMSIRPSSLDT